MSTRVRVLAHRCTLFVLCARKVYNVSYELTVICYAACVCAALRRIDTMCMCAGTRQHEGVAVFLSQGQAENSSRACARTSLKKRSSIKNQYLAKHSRCLPLNVIFFSTGLRPATVRNCNSTLKPYLLANGVPPCRPASIMAHM